MPFKGTRKVTPQQKSVMAVGKLAGKTSREVAVEVDLHPDVVRRHWGGHESFNLQLKREYAPSIRKLYEKMLRQTDRGLDDKNPRVRLLACRQVIQLVNAGDPPLERLAPAGLQSGDGIVHVTLEELLISYRQATMREKGEADCP